MPKRRKFWHSIATAILFVCCPVIVGHGPDAVERAIIGLKHHHAVAGDEKVIFGGEELIPPFVVRVANGEADTQAIRLAFRDDGFVAKNGFGVGDCLPRHNAETPMLPLTKSVFEIVPLIFVSFGSTAVQLCEHATVECDGFACVGDRYICHRILAFSENKFLQNSELQIKPWPLLKAHEFRRVGGLDSSFGRRPRGPSSKKQRERNEYYADQVEPGLDLRSICTNTRPMQPGWKIIAV